MAGVEPASKDKPKAESTCLAIFVVLLYGRIIVKPPLKPAF